MVMKVYCKIEPRNGLYIAQIDPPILSANEEEKIAQFGQPAIQIGGTFVGTVARPNYTPTTIAFSGGGGGGATGTVTLDANGGILSVTITAGGTGYASIPAVAITGVGVGASLQAVTLAGVVTSVTVIAPGYGYQMTPAYVNFTLPSSLRRMLTDFPVTQTFSLYDSYDADAQAQVWVQTVEANMITERDILLAQQAPLAGETLQTV